MIGFGAFSIDDISTWGVFSGCVLVSWLIGGIPFGFLAGKCNGIDIREQGSGNIGTTNVLRVLGKKWGAVVFVLDLGKGTLPVVGVGMLSAWLELGGMAKDWLPLSCGLAAILGHNFTPFLGFRGGKGIATSAGVVLGLMPAALLVSALIFAAGFGATRMVSVGSILAAFTLPIGTWFIYPGQWPLILFSVVAGVLGIWRHRSNLERILAGTEHRFGKSWEEQP